MKFLFTRSNKIGSRLIRWTLKEDCSHFAVCFDEFAAGSGIVFDSTMGGTAISWFVEFRKRQTIVHSLHFKTPLTLQEEEALYLGILKKYSGQGYDLPALSFWVWRGFLWRFFGRKLPRKNKWAVEGFVLCTGIAQAITFIRDWASSRGIDLELISPDSLYKGLKATGLFVDDPLWCDMCNIRAAIGQ